MMGKIYEVFRWEMILTNLTKNCITNQGVKVLKTKLKIHELNGKCTSELFLKLLNLKIL